MKERIEAALLAFSPQFLTVDNESHMHSRGDNSHFKVVVVADEFADMSKVKRHQRVYAVMGELMQQIHGLAVHTYTPEEWARVAEAPESPRCQGGGLNVSPSK